MQTTFFKYQATGNDFILIDNRGGLFPREDSSLIARLCHRRFGIGADGLILLENHASADFQMVYFNSDGNPGSMCGNGGRCIVAFARLLGLAGDTCRFMAVDGPHLARVDDGMVSLQMAPVKQVHATPGYLWLDTGSPHHVQLWENWEELDVPREGRRLRYGLYGASGSNINFVQALGGNRFRVRTYERGVEDETYSCGTGVTAVALAMHTLGRLGASPALIDTPGGQLEVRFAATGDGYSDIWLKGPAQLVFKGEWT